MPKYRITGPDGALYEVTAPQEASQADILSYVQKSAADNAPQREMAAKIGLPGAEMSAAPSWDTYSGMVLPLTKNSAGDVRFDPSAGMLSPLTLPGDVYAGKVAPDGPEAIARGFGLAAMASPLPPGARPPVGNIMGAPTRREPAIAPTQQELRAAAKEGYTSARSSDVRYNTPAVNEMAYNAQQAMERDGFRADQSPNTFSILADLQKNPGDGSFASLDDLHSARKALNRAAGNFNNPTEQAAANRALVAVDEFIKNADPQTLVDRATASQAERAGQQFADANANYAAAKRSERLGKAQSKGELNAAVANSGQNTDNAIRQQLKSLLQDDKRTRGFSDEEVDAIIDAARGGRAANTLRIISNLMGGGGGLGSIVSGGMAAGGSTYLGLPGELSVLVGSGVPATGMALRNAAGRMAKNRVAAVDEMVRQRSPLFRQRQADAPVVANDADTAGMLARMLVAPPMAASAQPPVQSYWARRLLGLPDMSGT